MWVAAATDRSGGSSSGGDVAAMSFPRSRSEIRVLSADAGGTAARARKSATAAAGHARGEKGTFETTRKRKRQGGRIASLPEPAIGFSGYQKPNLRANWTLRGFQFGA